VHALDLRTGREKRLLDDVAQAWYLPGGRLFYVRRDGVALVAPFDLGRLEITGSAIPLYDGVYVGGGFAQLAWTDAGSLIYVRGTGGTQDNVVTRVSRAGAAVPVDSAWRGPLNSLALSPDGRRLAVGLGATTGGLNVWIKQLDRGPVTRLSFGGEDRRPAWSPDGRWVAFVRDTAATSIVVARPADGSGQDRVLARLDRRIQEVSWSRDGRWLLLRTDNGQAGAGDLVGVRTAGDTTPVPLIASPFTELHPALSPDGRWLAYTSNESGVNEVYVRPFPAANGGRWQVSNGGGSEPRWSGDGREIFFLDAGNRVVAAQVRGAPTFALVGSTPLFSAASYTIDAFHQAYDVSPDGRAFYFLSPLPAARNAPGPQLVRVDNWLADVRAKLEGGR
jgi:serine/threonine-protein kinase